MSMRAAILIPDGVGLRNFVLGPFLHELAREATQIDIFHVIPDQFFEQYTKDAPKNVRWRKFLPLSQTRSMVTMQYIVSYAHLYWGNTPSMQRTLARKVKGSFVSRTWVKSTMLAGRVAAALGATDNADSLYHRMAHSAPEVAEYRKLFSEIKPDVVFCSNQRPSAALAGVLGAQDLGIPTASFIYSWDNLSSKGRISAPFDHYLVWSRYMSNELRKFYPRVVEKNVHIVGTPQFDYYGDRKLLWSREEFFRRIGADPARKLICFSGGDTLTCPEDPLHVDILMKLIRSGKIEGNPQLCVRPVPVDDGKRYQAVRDRYPELLFCQPEWVFPESGNWSKVLPTAADTQFLANMTHHADMNINLGSTMTLDFGIHDKPVVNTAFDVNDPPLFGMPVYDYYYQYDHFQPVLKFGASRVARSPEQLAEFVSAYLRDPGLDRAGRQKLVDQQVEIPLGKSCRAVTEALCRIANRVPKAEMAESATV